MPRLPVPFFVQQPDDQQLVEVFGLPDTDPDTATVCRWHHLLGQLVLPDLSVLSTRGGFSWRPTRRGLVKLPVFDFQVPTVEEYIAEGNCPVCAEKRISDFYASEQFYELFPTDDDGTEEERRDWEQHLFGDDPDPDEVAHCPNCSQVW